MAFKTVFRVRGIPEEVTLDALKRTLSRVDGNEELKIKATIAPSCYNRTQTALVEFDPLPSYLKDSSNADWDSYDMEIETDAGELFDITIDKNFFGLTQLYPTKTDNITADIVAVTRLSGNAFESWRGKGELGRMWLRDFLSVDLPNCRTMTYGYYSRIRSHGVHQIRDYSRGFLEELKKARMSEEERKRPIIFIGHSFGGIIVAQSLVRSKECNPNDDPGVYSIHQATHGVIFYGTSHRGLLVDDILSILDPEEHSDRVKLINSINKSSDLLHSELERFVDFAMQLRIISFYERFKTRRLVQGLSDGFSRTGEYMTIADTDSALLNLGAAVEKKIPVDADNVEIVKFKNRQNQAYSSTLLYLQEFERDLKIRASAPSARRDPSPSLGVHFAGSLEAPERCGRRSSSTHSNSREQSQETRVNVWTSDRGRLILSTGRAAEFYQLIAQPYHRDQGVSLSTQRVDYRAPLRYTSHSGYPVELLDQLQYGSEKISLNLDELNSENLMALSSRLYTPDKSHPFRGIWIGLYPKDGTHEYEYFLFHQPAEDSLIIIKITGNANIRGESCVFSNPPHDSLASVPHVNADMRSGGVLLQLRSASRVVLCAAGKYDSEFSRVDLEQFCRDNRFSM